MKRIAIVAILAIAVIAVGAGAVYYQGAYMAPAPGPTTSPTVSIASPNNGDAIQGSAVTVAVASSGFSVPAQGHYHIYLDSALQMAFDQASTVTFNNVAPGTHTITAYLANPDHSLLSPQVSQTITINVAAPAAASAVSVTSPANGAAIQGSTLTVAVASTNFNIPSQGDYWVYLDNSYLAGNGPTFTFTNVAPGTHTIYAQLYNADGTPVSPAVVSPTITITASSGGVGGMAPAISIVSPSGGSTVQGPAVTVTVSSANFNMPAQGYYYVSLDGMSYATGNGPTFTFPSVTSGTHTITADIRNPDGTMLNPDVSQAVTITVTGGVGGGSGGY